MLFHFICYIQIFVIKRFEIGLQNMWSASIKAITNMAYIS